MLVKRGRTARASPSVFYPFKKKTSTVTEAVDILAIG